MSYAQEEKKFMTVYQKWLKEIWKPVFDALDEDGKNSVNCIREQMSYYGWFGNAGERPTHMLYDAILYKRYKKIYELAQWLKSWRGYEHVPYQDFVIKFRELTTHPETLKAKLDALF